LALSVNLGEDYVLLGTVPEKSADRLARALEDGGCEFFPIGRIVAEPGLNLLAQDGSKREIKPAGWNHFT
jgi:thiamine monophosphate kinase